MKIAFIILIISLLTLPAFAKPKPYNDAYYDIAYQAFVANNNTDKAVQVAKDALYWLPDDLVWRRRLAQAALWNGDSSEALAASLIIARKTQLTADWEAVIKLAPSDFNYALELEARMALLQKSPNNEALIEAIKKTYILLGKEAEGLERFQKFYKSHPNAATLKAKAEMAKLSGNELLSGYYYEQYFELYGYDIPKVLEIIDSYWLLDRQQDAYLLAESALQSSQNEDLIRRRAAMAYYLGHWPEALKQYGLLFERNSENSSDRFYYLSLLRLHEPETLANKTLLLWQRNGQSIYASQYFYSLLAQNKYQEIALFLRKQAPEQLQKLSKDDEFNRILALYYQQVGQYKQAQESLHRALNIAPLSQPNRIAWLWFLIEIADRDQLQLLLNHWQAGLSSNEEGLRVLSAASFALGQGDDAVKFEREIYTNKPTSWRRQWFYWQALNAAGQTDRANKILLQLRKSLPAEAPVDDWKVYYFAAKHQLIMHFGNGSEVMAFNQKIQAANDLNDKQKAEFAAQWAQSQNSPALAGIWYKKYAKMHFYQRQKMTFAQALYNEDDEAIRAIFSSTLQQLNPTEQLSSEMAVGEMSLAKNTFADLQNGMPSWTTQQPFQEALLLDQSDAWQFNSRHQSLGGLTISQYQLSQQKAVSDFSRWSLAAKRIEYQDNGLNFIHLDEVEQQLSLGFSSHEKGNFIAAELWFRQLFEQERLGAKFVWRKSYKYAFNSQLVASINEPANETSLLNVIGERSGVSASVGWLSAKYWQNRINSSFFQYHDIDDNTQGKSQLWDIISEFQPWRSRFSPGVRLQATVADFYDKQGLAKTFANISRLPANAKVLPNDYWQMQASLLLGQQDVHIRAHRLHAWAEIGVLENSEFGQGYNAKAGIEGSLLGRDEWQLLLEQSFNQGGIKDASYAIELNYQMYY